MAREKRETHDIVMGWKRVGEKKAVREKGGADSGATGEQGRGSAWAWSEGTGVANMVERKGRT